MYTRYRTWIATAIAEGVAAGEFARVDPGDTADLAMALIDGLGLRVLLGDPSMPTRTRARADRDDPRARASDLRAGQLPFAADAATAARSGPPVL